MSKAPKNDTGSGGDERNTYIRRYKSTSNPSKASSSNASLAGRQSEFESFNRPKHIGGSVAKPQGVGRSSTRSKLRSPVKTGLGVPTNRVNKPNTVSTNKVVKKPSEDTKTKSQMTKMKQETESSERKQKTSTLQTENKESTEQVEINKQIKESNNSEEQSSNQQENGNANGLNGKEVPSEENPKEEESKENGNAEKEVSETNEKEEEFDLHLEVEENGIKSEEGTQNESSETETNKEDEKSQKSSSEEVREDSKTDAESCSVDVVESTTSEVSEATESSALSETKDKDNGNQDANSEPVSYDSSIMLKDVQIKLNDCLKDSKGEENNVEQSLPEYAHKEASFGTTLRKISGRSSIGRMRNITLRERQPSPNSSLFVNTSNISLDEISDYKTLRHRSGLSELSSSINGTPYDRKRKLIEENLSASKKPKTEESSSLLNASFEFLKHPFQRPSQVSTPYKFQTDKHNLSTSEEAITNDESGISKKWCLIM